MTARRSGTGIALTTLIVLTGVGAIPAGIGFLTDPSGANLGMTPEMLRRGPFHDYTIPGLFLVVVLGLGAAVPAWALLTGRRWAARAALGYGLVLLAWITIQAWIIGVVSPLQPVFGTIGLLTAAFALAARQESTAA